MARNLSPITKQSRREGVALHNKAFKIMAKRVGPPGQHGQNRRTKASQYSIQLREKQKVKRMYGLLEKQFRKLITESSKSHANTGELLLQLLERRLDNVVYRAGFASSRRAARQLVSHGHFMLNDRRVDIPSIRVKEGDSIVLRSRSSKLPYFVNFQDLNPEAEQAPLSWLKADGKKFSIKITGLPTREEAEPGINEQLIVEYYSR